MNKELLFSITKEDFDWQTFRSGGPGGQNQNKVSSGVRCIHRVSGARGESRQFRDQIQNKKYAFAHCVETPEFKAWMKLEIAKRTGSLEKVENKVGKMMDPKYLKIEYLGYDDEEI